MTRDVLGLWSLLDPYRLDVTAPAWLRSFPPLLGRHRTESARLSADYYQRFRTLELADAEPHIPPP